MMALGAKPRFRGDTILISTGMLDAVVSFYGR